jgi:hypothetical protein
MPDRAMVISPASPQAGNDRTDIPALSAAVVAVSVTIFMEPGPYVATNAIVGLTVSMLVVAYVYGRRRSIYHSFTVSFVLALSLLPVTCFAIETALSGDPARFLERGEPFPCADAIRFGQSDPAKLADQECEPGSNVTEIIVLSAWTMLSILAFIADRASQPAERGT